MEPTPESPAATAPRAGRFRPDAGRLERGRVLSLHDRAIGLLAEILQGGRVRGDLAAGADVLASARALFHVATGARISWANGLLGEGECRHAIEASVDLLFRGIGKED